MSYLAEGISLRLLTFLILRMDLLGTMPVANKIPVFLVQMTVHGE